MRLGPTKVEFDVKDRDRGLENIQCKEYSPKSYFVQQMSTETRAKEDLNPGLKLWRCYSTWKIR